jgi:hypothetical protein
VPEAVDQRSHPGYTERLWVPIGWWVLTALFAISLLVAVLFYLGPIWGFGSGLLVMVVMGLLFYRYGREQIRVESDRFWVGAANIEWAYVTAGRALDEATTRRRRGPESDARAYLVLRPYLNRAVEVTLDDVDDPTPYWLISSRAPERLAAAISAHCAAPAAPGNPPGRGVESGAESVADRGTEGAPETAPESCRGT